MRNGTESVSAPSAIQFVKPSLVLSSNYKDINDTLTPNIDITKMQWIQYHIFSDKNYAFIILVSFLSVVLSEFFNPVVATNPSQNKLSL